MAESIFRNGAGQPRTNWHESVSPVLLRQTQVVVLAGGCGTRLLPLTRSCAKPAMPFGGKFKVIDFALSNCVNSGLRRISVLTQTNAQSLIRHLARAWRFLDAERGEYVDIVPAHQQVGEAWYRGTADAVYQNLAMLEAADPKYVLVLAGDHVYRMDYSRLLAAHEGSGAEVTIGSTEVPIEQAGDFGVLRADPYGRVLGFEEKPARPQPIPGRPDSALVSMGIYVFDAARLAREVRRDAASTTSSHDFGCDLLPHLIGSGRVFAHDLRDSCIDGAGAPPYWRDVGTHQAYWEANLELTRRAPRLDLLDPTWPIRSLPDHLPAARFVSDGESRPGCAVDSVVGSGCVVDGAMVRRSVLFEQVKLASGGRVEDSVLLARTRVGRNAIVQRAIVDADCMLPDGIRIGVNIDEDRARFFVTEQGLTIVTPEMLAAGAVWPGAFGANTAPARAAIASRVRDGALL